MLTSVVALANTRPLPTFDLNPALIRAYISNGLRKHLAELEAQRAKDTTVEEFSRRLIAHGMPEHAIEQAAAEMRAEQLKGSTQDDLGNVEKNKRHLHGSHFRSPNPTESACGTDARSSRAAQPASAEAGRKMEDQTRRAGPRRGRRQAG